MDLLQALGSLLAILALAGLALWLKLGGAPALSGEDDARAAAADAVDGFVPHRFGIDREGRGALLEDADGRILLLKLHGNRFAGRLLEPGAHAHEHADTLRIDIGERRFGAVSLTLDDGAYWERAINRLGKAGNA